MFKIILLFFFLVGNVNAIELTAQSWLVADEKGKIIQGENTKAIRSIASITKLVSAMVVLDAKQNLDEKINQFTRRELLQLSIVKSDNNAARLLCEKYPGGLPACIAAMNKKVHLQGFMYTRFTDPTGLDAGNVSNAEELVDLVLLSKDYPELIEYSKMSEVKIKIRKNWMVFNNTNPIIGKRHDFIISKTGYIKASGGCIVMMLDTDVGKRIVVVLGSKNTKTRIPEAEFISQM
jgi:D-alanyl-D-alanine endopeptidase (penicillin-binding protein 7)